MDTEKQWLRFLSKVSMTDSCWDWRGPKINSGYGQFSYGRKKITAHRASYLFHIGKIPKNKIIMHSCDNKVCVSPFHLNIGTQQDNMTDKMLKGRAPTGNAHINTKISDDNVILAKEMVKYGMSRKKVAKHFNVSRTLISFICSGKARKVLSGR